MKSRNNRKFFCCSFSANVLPGLCLAALLLMAVPGWGASVAREPSLPEATIVSRGPHQRVWQTFRYKTNAIGSVTVTTNSYTELGTGICYEDNGKWVDSEELIEILPDGSGAATRGAHKAFFAANLNTAGAIRLNTPDRKQFTSRVLGIAFTDAASGKSEMIGQVKDSIGEMIAPNQILYRDAFTDIKADVRYTYTLSG